MTTNPDDWADPESLNRVEDSDTFTDGDVEGMEPDDEEPEDG